MVARVIAMWVVGPDVRPTPDPELAPNREISGRDIGEAVQCNLPRQYICVSASPDPNLKWMLLFSTTVHWASATRPTPVGAHATTRSGRGACRAAGTVYVTVARLLR